MPDELLSVRRMLPLNVIEQSNIDFIESNKTFMRREMGAELVGEIEDFGPSRVTLAWTERQDDRYLTLELTATFNR